MPTEPNRFSSTSPADSKIAELRVPPQSVEAEQAVLGGLLLSPRAFDDVTNEVAAEDFYRREHQVIFQAIEALNSAQQPTDLITVGNLLKSRGQADLVANGAYLTELATTTPSAANIKQYASIVRDKAILRQMIDVGTSIINKGFQPDGRASRDILAEAEAEVLRIAETRSLGKADFTTINDALAEAFTMLNERAENGGGITGLPTGYEDFDKLTAGLQKTDLVILAARPAMGKTAFALNIAQHAALNPDKPVNVAVYSMEMSASQLAMRLISSVGRIDAQRLRTGQLEDMDWPRVSLAIKQLNSSAGKIFIDDEPGLSPTKLAAKARRLKREQNGELGLIVIDYLQLMSVPGNSENRATEISEISRSLKGLAKELNVPVIALSQLNRSLETRTDKRPQMADLRESGAIEQDADMIVFIYRDEYYHKENTAAKGIAEIIIGKQRSGPTGTCRLRFFGEYTRFDNLARDAEGIYDSDYE